MMNKITKVILIGMACYLIYLAYFTYEIIRYGHSMDFETCKQYLWIFKDSKIKNLKDPQYGGILCSSSVKKHDINNILHYYHNNDMYIVTVWEFKDLAKIDLSKIVVDKNVDFSNIKFWSKETLDAQSTRPITIKYGFSFHNAININLDSSSEIYGTIKGSNYKGFYGKVHKMSFSNERGEHQIVFEHIDNIFNHLTNKYNPSFPYTVFLAYKGHGSFYVIIINSKKPFKDASVINILNLP